MEIILILGIFISLFQTVLLLNKTSKSLPDKILMFAMFIISQHLLSYYLYHSGYWDLYPHLIGTAVPLPFFYGPVLLLYVKYSLENRPSLSLKDYLHFIPIAASYAYMCRFYFFYTAAEKKLVDQGTIQDFDLFANFLLAGFIISGISYSIIAHRFLGEYKKLLDNNFSNSERINLNWLKAFIWILGIIFLTVTIVVVTRDILGTNYPFNPEYIFYTMLVLAILALGYFGIRHQNIFVENAELSQQSSKASYAKSGLKKEMAEKKHQQLVGVMENEKPYLQPKLTLNSLSKSLEISPNHLSQIINQFEQQNFNDFVNKYRVEEFIQRAKEQAHLSFLSLALDSGFNSKSTFNAVFKKHKSITPSKFLSKQISQ